MPKHKKTTTKRRAGAAKPKERDLDKGMLARISGKDGETPLGHLGKPETSYEEWYSVLIQMGHDDDGPAANRHSPTCPEPVFRILKFCKTAREARDSKIALQKGIKGHIFEHRRNTVAGDGSRMPGFTLICKTLARQSDASYVWPTKAAIEQQFWDHDKYIDDEFVSSMLSRNEGRRDDAIQEHRDYTRRYNKKGWIRYMRAEHKIPNSVTIIPGMHKEAEVMAKKLRRKGVKPPKILGDEETDEEENSGEEEDIHDEEEDIQSTNLDEDEKEIIEKINLDDVAEGEEEEEEEEDEEEEEEDYEVESEEDSDEETKHKENEMKLKFPSSLRTRGQRYAAISFIMSDSKDMELMLYIHAVYPSRSAAKEDVNNNLDDRLKPLPIDVVDMYAVVYPVRMLWEGSAMSDRVVGMMETWGGVYSDKLGETQTNRLKATEESRHLKEDVMRRQKKEQKVIDAINDRLDIDEATQNALFAHFGPEKIKALCAMDDDDARKEKLSRYVKKIEEVNAK